MHKQKGRFFEQRTRLLTREKATLLAELLVEGKFPREIYSQLGVNYQTFSAWIMDALFGAGEDRTPELKILRDALLNYTFREVVIGKVIEVISEPQEKVTLKTTTLHTIAKTDESSLAKRGETEFLKQFKEDGVTLRVERTSEMMPVPIMLLEKLIKLVESDSSIDDISQKLANFNPPHPDTPEV